MSDLSRTRDHALKRAGTSTTTASDAALWLQIAAEIDAYLSHEDDKPMLPTADDTPLFEEEG
jgi:hypothetical protein